MGKPKKSAKIASRSKGAETANAARNAKYVIVRKDDARIAKYAHAPGGEGFSLEDAQLKAIPAHPDQPAYGLITVEQYEFIQNHAEPITPQAAVNLFARENPAAGDSDEE